MLVLSLGFVLFDANPVVARDEGVAESIVAEVMLRVESELFLQHFVYGGSGQLIFSPGVIEPDTIVAFYWDDPVRDLADVESVRLPMPIDVAPTLGRYLPSAITISDTVVAIAVSTSVFLFNVARDGAMIDSIELPVVATGLDLRNDTLYFAADQWNTAHSPLKRSRRSAFFGFCPLGRDSSLVEYHRVDEPLGLVMNLFQPRAFLGVHGEMTAYVKGLVDSVILLRKGEEVASTGLESVCSDDIKHLLIDYEIDSSWTVDPHPALGRIRAVYKDHDVVRTVCVDSDSTITLRVDHQEVHSDGLLAGRNVSKMYRWKRDGDRLLLENVLRSRSPSLADVPSTSVPFSQHMYVTNGALIAFESINAAMSDKRSWEELIEENERSVRIGVHQFSVSRRE